MGDKRKRTIEMGDKGKRLTSYSHGGGKSGDSSDSHPTPAVTDNLMPVAEGDNRRRSLGKRPTGDNPGRGEGGDSSRRRGSESIVHAEPTPGAKARCLRIKSINYDTSEEGPRAHFSMLVEQTKIHRISLDRRIRGG